MHEETSADITIQEQTKKLDAKRPLVSYAPLKMYV